MISFHKHLTPTAVKERLGELTRPTGTEDILTIDYPEVKQLRWRIEPAVALKLAAVIVVIAVGFLGWQRYFKPPEPHHPFPMPAAAAAPTEEPTSTASPGSLVVSVVGEVEHPGLHTLAPDARIADALAAAQPYPHGQTLGLNLAQKLTDGQQIHVPHVDAGEVIPVDSTTGGASGAAGTAANTTGTDGKISLNNLSPSMALEPKPPKRSSPIGKPTVGFPTSPNYKKSKASGLRNSPPSPRKFHYD